MKCGVPTNIYLKYFRKGLSKFLPMAQMITWEDFLKPLNEKDFYLIDQLLKKKVTSFYYSKHEGFKSFAEHFEGMSLSDISFELNKARRDFSVKPASWFKTIWAFDICTRLKQEYGATSILDPFHGWGARAMGAICAQVGYTGIDANELLHFELNESSKFLPLHFIHGDSFKVDLSNVNFDAVFSCPPYWIAEYYDINKTIIPKSYNAFLNRMVRLTQEILEKDNVKVVAWAVEHFVVKSKKYDLNIDLINKLTAKGFLCNEYIFAEMSRSYNNDTKKLRLIEVTRRRVDE